MTLRTPICDMLGIEYPIFAAGMGGVTMAPLTAAISAAGGCGVLGATFCTPEELRAEIRAVREITDKPFGVDLLIPGDIPEDLSAREVPPFPDFLEDLMPKVEGLKGKPAAAAHRRVGACPGRGRAGGESTADGLRPRHAPLAGGGMPRHRHQGHVDGRRGAPRSQA